MDSVFIELVVIVDRPDDMREPVGRLATQVPYDEPYLIRIKKADGEDRFPHENRQLALGGPRLFSTSASVIIIIIGSIGHS